MEKFFFILIFIFLYPTIIFRNDCSLIHPCFKFITSLCFLLCGIFSIKKSKSTSSFSKNIILGLFLDMIGDVILVSSIPNSFVFGALSFALGHICFIKAFIMTKNFKLNNFLFCILTFTIFTYFILTSNIFKFDGMEIIVLVYAFIIIVMSVSALTLIKSNLLLKNFIICGSLLFVLSDFILLFIKFAPNSPSYLGIFNLLLYYSGQGLLALSLSKQ